MSSQEVAKLKALESLEHIVEDLEYLRHGCEVVGLKDLADHLAELAGGLRQNIAVLQAQSKRRRAKGPAGPKLVVSN